MDSFPFITYNSHIVGLDFWELVSFTSSISEGFALFSTTSSIFSWISSGKTLKIKQI